jgi:hypothetical protein
MPHTYISVSNKSLVLDYNRGGILHEMEHNMTLILLYLANNSWLCNFSTHGGKTFVAILAPHGLGEGYIRLRLTGATN